MATTHQSAMPVRLGRDHVGGARSAPVTLLEYGDYECPRCGVAHAFVEDVRHHLDDDLRFAFRHLLIEAIEVVRRLAAGPLPGSGVRTQ